VPRPLFRVFTTLFLGVVGGACGFAQGQRFAAQTQVDETRDVRLSGPAAGGISAGISIIHFPPTQKILLAAAPCNCKSTLQCKVLSRASAASVGRWKHAGTEMWEGALSAEAVRGILPAGRDIKTEIPDDSSEAR